MSVLDSGKPFHELTASELAELEAHDWTSEQIQRAITMALKQGELEAAVDLLHRLARKDPKVAAAILAVIEVS